MSGPVADDPAPVVEGPALGADITRRQLFLSPARWFVIAGAILILVGAWLPWQTMIYPLDVIPRVVTGVSTPDAPGYQLLFFIGVLVVLALSPGVAGSDTRTVQFLPAAFGLAAMFVAAEAYQGLAPNINDVGQSSQVVLEAGLWMSLVGSALGAFGGLAISVMTFRAGRRREAARHSAAQAAHEAEAADEWAEAVEHKDYRRPGTA